MKTDLLRLKSIYNIIPASERRELYVTEASYRHSQPDISKQQMSKPYFALHLFLHGSGRLITPTGTHEIGPDDIWVRFPTEKITYYDYERDPWSYVFITFQGSQAQRILSKLNITPQNRLLRSNERLGDLFTECVLSCYQNPACKDMLADAYLEMIFAELATIRISVPQQGPSARAAYVDKAISFIENNLADTDLDAQSASSYLNLNTDYFLRIFKQETGVPFTDFVISKRLNNAAAIFENQSDALVSKVSEAVGYADVSYFSYSFKKAYGLCPSEYIRKMRAKQADRA